MEKILVILKTGTIKGSYVDKDVICRYDSLTEQIALLAKGKNVAIASSHIKNAEEMADILKDEFHVIIENVSVLHDKNNSIWSFIDDELANVEMLIMALDEKPDRYFPEFFSENYLKKVLYLDAFINGCAWAINLGKNTMSIVRP